MAILRIALGTLVLLATMLPVPVMSESDEIGTVGVQALKQYVLAQPATPAQADILAWLVATNPFGVICGEIIESPFIVGVNQALRPIPGQTGYFVDLPLAAYGAVEETANGSEINANRENNAFQQDDLNDYLQALGIYYTSHDGIGTTSYLQITASTTTPPLLC